MKNKKIPKTLISIIIVLNFILISIDLVCAQCVPTGPEIYDNLADEDCDGWINGSEYNIKTNHPRLPHPNEQFLTELNNNSIELNKYIEVADSFDPLSPTIESTRKLTITYLITKNSKYFDKIKQLLNAAMSGYDKIPLYLFSIAYDWTYNDLDASTRQAFENKIDTHCTNWENMYASIGVSPYNDVGYIRLSAGLFVAAPVIFSEHPNGKSHFEFAKDILINKYLPVWKQIMAGGGWHEGIEYTNNGIGGCVIVPALTSWRSATGQDLFQEHPWLEQFIYYPIYTTKPDMIALHIGDVAWFNGLNIAGLLGLAMEYNNPYGRWWYRNIPKKGPVDNWAVPATDYEPSSFPWGAPDSPSLEVSSTSTLPLFHYFDGWGTAVMRSGWTEDDIYATFRVGDNFWSHQHFDSGSFTIYKRGALAIDSGSYGCGYSGEHHIKYAMHTVAHNCITVTDPNDDYPGAINPWGKLIDPPNDGGQRRVGSLYHSSPDDINDWQEEIDYETGDMLRVESTEQYDYLMGDLKSAYNNAKSGAGDFRTRTNRVDAYTRSFVYLRPDIFVVYDKISSTNPDFKKRWLLHSINEPQVLGDTTTIIRADNVEWRYIPDLGYQSTWVSGLKYKNGNYYQYNGKMFVKTLLPLNFLINKVGGSGHEFEVNGVNYNHDMWGGTVDANPLYGPREPGAWRIEVEPAAAQKDDLFLHVLYPCDITTASMPATVRINASTNNMVGAHIKTAPKNYVVMFISDPNEADVTGTINYTINSTANITHHLLFNLLPNTTYNVTAPQQANQTITVVAGFGSYKSSSQGVLNFDVLSSNQPPKAPENLTIIK